MVKRLTWVPSEQGKLDLRVEEDNRDNIGEGAIEVKVQRSLIDGIPVWAWENYKESPWIPQCSFMGGVIASEIDGWTTGQAVIGIGQASNQIRISPRQVVTVHRSDFDESTFPYLGLHLRVMGALRLASLSIGEHVLILGTGVIGQLAAQWLHIAGAGRIVLNDTRKPELINKWIEFETIEKNRYDERNEREFDMLIDTSGNTGWIHDQSTRLRQGGRIVLLANDYQQADFDFYQPVHTRSLSVVGKMRWEAGNRAQEMSFISHLLRTGRLNADALDVATVAPSSREAKPVNSAVMIKWE